MYPQIQESGRLEIANPPEERDDLTQFPGALTLTFTDQVVNGIAHEPIGIAAGYSRTFNGNWLGGEQPTLSVLYRVKDS